jgi:hypothetical protein
MSISTPVRKHLICELQQNEQTYNKCSRNFFHEIQRTSQIHLIIDHHICSKMLGTFKPVSIDWGTERAVQTPNMEKCALDHVDRDVGVSIRQVEEELNVSHMTIWRVLHEELFTLPAAFLARDLLSVFCSTKC